MEASRPSGIVRILLRSTALLTTGLAAPAPAAPQFPPTLDLSTLDESEGIVFLGRSEGDRAGWRVGPAGDVNGDGRGDLLITAPTAGESSRDYVTLPWDNNVALVDVDGDGDPDVVVPSSTQSEIAIHVNDGSGVYSGPTSVQPSGATGPRHIASGDVDGDLVVDLAVAHSESGHVVVFLGDGAGGFVQAGTFLIGPGVSHAILEDLDADGDRDLVTSNPLQDNVAIRLNDGTGTFVSQTLIAVGQTPRSVRADLLDGDGLPDVVVTNEGHDSVSVLINTGGGTFAPRVDYPTGKEPYDLVFADMDGDSLLDIVTTNDSTTQSISVLLNTGPGALSAPSHFGGHYGGRGLVSRDFDQDGDQDIASSNIGNQNVTVYLNDGTGVLTGPDEYPVPSDEVPFAPQIERMDSADVDGDGDDDLVVAAPGVGMFSVLVHIGAGVFSKHEEAGFTYVVFGGTEPPAGGVFDLEDLVSGNDGFVIIGVDQYDESGTSAACAGDVNGDGIDDIVVGAPLADPLGEDKAGEAYVVFGRDDLVDEGRLFLAHLDGTDGFRIEGILGSPADLGGDRAGYDVAGIGDFDGDGVDDVAVSAPGAMAGFGYSFTGEIYVLRGATDVGAGGVFPLSTLDGVNGFTIRAALPQTDTGTSIAGPGDFNGDGLNDLFIGAPYAGAPGEGYVVYGGQVVPYLPILSLASLVASVGLTLIGTDNGEALGWSVAPAGDVNGDGLPDLVLGSPELGPASSYGRATVFLGGPHVGAVHPFDLSTLDASTGFRLDGEASTDRAGWSVASAGDVDGDGTDDILVGAPGEEDDFFVPGRAYVIFGDPAISSSGDVPLASIDGTNGFVLVGGQNGDNAGWSVAPAGDFDGDGVEDFLVGAPGADAKGSHSGAAYLIYGRKLLFDVDVTSVSVSQGGTQNMQLSAGQDHAGELYRVVGSMSGTSPGYVVGPVTLPLNFDTYMKYTIFNPNEPPLIDTMGFLDGSGEATAAFSLHPGSPPSLVGISLHHAYGTYDVGAAMVTLASNPQPLDLTP